MIDEEKTSRALTTAAKSAWGDAAQVEQRPSIMLNVELMGDVYKIARLFAASSLVPECYRGGEKSVGLANCFAALSMGFELGITPMQALSHIVVVNGRPAIDGQLAISLANRRASIIGGIRYEEGGKEDQQYCTAWTQDKETLERKEYTITIADAKKAGWFAKSHSHWNKDPRLMLRYRAASYLVRTYYPDAVMGLHTIEELQDVEATKKTIRVTELRDRLEDQNGTKQTDEQSAQKASKKAKATNDGDVLRGDPIS